MKTGRPKAMLVLMTEQLARMRALIASRSMPQGLAARARIILWAHEGAQQHGDCRHIGRNQGNRGQVASARFLRDRVVGLHDELRPGRPPLAH
jgi:hypothetical protein